MSLHELIHHLAHQLLISAPAHNPSSGDWQILEVTGGLNNRVYRAISGRTGQDLAIKFYTRDARDRAGREFAILDLLQRLRLNIAPHPVLLDRFATEPRLAPVVVQTWLPGDVSAAPPDSDTDWQRLLDHLRAVHAIQQEPAWAIPQAILTMTSAADSLQEIDIQVAKLPAAARPTELMALHALVHDRAWPT